MRKKILTLLIITVLLVTGCSKKNEDKNEELANAISSFLQSTGETETSIKALKAKNYYNKSDVDECMIVNIVDNKINYVKKDCDLADKYANDAQIILNSDGDYKIDGWNNKEGKIFFNIISSDRVKYSKDNIKNIEFTIGNNYRDNFFNEIYIPANNFNDTGKLTIEFKNGEVLEKKFQVMVDVDAPKIVKKELNQLDYMVSYEDFSGIEGIYYGLTDDDEKPNKDSMELEPQPSLNCGTKYNVWTYARDFAGNDSDIELAGSFTFTCN